MLHVLHVLLHAGALPHAGALLAAVSVGALPADPLFASPQPVSSGLPQHLRARRRCFAGSVPSLLAWAASTLRRATALRFKRNDVQKVPSPLTSPLCAGVPPPSTPKRPFATAELRKRARSASCPREAHLRPAPRLLFLREAAATR